MPRIEFKEGTPARQGFYRVKLEQGGETIAELREYDKKEGKRWWTYTSDEPTVEKTRVALGGVVGYAKVDDSEVAHFMRRSLTRAERIEKAYQDYISKKTDKPIWSIAIPESRRLQVGQEVTVGSWREVRVAGLYEDGKVVVIEFHREMKARGDEPAQLDPTPSYAVYSWIDVLPKDGLVQGLVRPRRLVQPESVTQIQSLVHRMYMDETDDNPDYQRDYTWTQKDKDLYLDSFFNGRNLGRFVFVVDGRTGRIEVLDGKQRLNTLMELVTSTIPYRGAYWHQLSRSDRQQLMSQTVQFVDLQAHDFSRLDRLLIFREVNVAGVPQTLEHMRKIDQMIEEELAKLGQAREGTPA
jgi:hypothetical protein